uniref:ILCR1 Ig-like domain-containing protein n=1 Tax=Romanomermis culicivorax TaxID=13658 RepID=A0A915HNV9_ROMCU
MVTVPSRIPDPFQLRVNLSWKIQHGSVNRTRGFRIKFVDRFHKTRICFLYFLQDGYVPLDFKMKHWFHFWIHDWFRFGTQYFVSISTIPRHPIETNATNLLTSSKQMGFTTPEHPEISDADFSNCSYSAHQDASRWIGAFRDVIVWPWANKLVAVFVAAPPKYCFEAYRLRLNRYNMIEKEVVIHSSSLVSEQLGNTSIQYGNYTFDNVTPGVYSLLTETSKIFNVVHNEK